MPSKKPVRSNTSTKATKSAWSTAKSAWSKTFSGVTGRKGAGAIAVVAVCVVAAAIVMAVRDASEPTEVAAADAQAATVAAKSARPNAPAASRTKAPAKTVAAETNATPAADNASTPKSSTALSASVTVAGCLERADNGFRLKDTTGEDAPRSRSWKSGFLKKGAAPVAIVDAAHGLKLADHVGQRVSVTGTLIDREMRAHSLRRLAASCK